MYGAQNTGKIPGYTGHIKTGEVVDQRPMGQASKKIPGNFHTLSLLHSALTSTSVFLMKATPATSQALLPKMSMGPHTQGRRTPRRPARSTGAWTSPQISSIDRQRTRSSVTTTWRPARRCRRSLAFKES